MPRVTIDGIEYEVRDGRNMLEAALDNGLNLPYFCWHPAMGSVGACRLCAVKAYKDENDTKGKIVMACMTPAIDGARISMNDPEAIEFRRYVIEWLMNNHPHDCPVCDEGGECHLQDMTCMTGDVYRRYRFKKRTFRNQYLGPLVNHELNRCIQCYRCVRYYRDLAGGRDLNVFGIHNNLYFGRDEDGVLESEFSGNLVEVCPTGVFTDKTYDRHYTRKWDLESAPSVCIHCGLGCNTIPAARQGLLRRVTARFNGDVNGYFLCDRGRYGYEVVNGKSRVESRESGVQVRVGYHSIREGRGRRRVAESVVGIELCSEAARRGRQLLHRAFRVRSRRAELALKILKNGPARTPSLAEVERADVILVLGADPTNEAPMLDFAIRQAMRKAPLDIARKLKIPDWDANAVTNALQNATGKLYIVSPWRIKIEGICGEHFHGAPSDIADFASRINDTVRTGWAESDSLPARIAKDLAEAHKPLIITSISAGPEIVKSAANIAWTIREHGKDCWLSIISPEANTIGAAMLGGLSADDALAKIESGEADTLIVLENDLTRRVTSDTLESALAKVKNLIVLDLIQTPLTKLAHILIPTPAWVETNGTFVSSECRAQRFFEVFVPGTEPEPAWRSLQSMGTGTNWAIYEDILGDLAVDHPALAGACDAAPHADLALTGGPESRPHAPSLFGPNSQGRRSHHLRAYAAGRPCHAIHPFDGGRSERRPRPAGPTLLVSRLELREFDQ